MTTTKNLTPAARAALDSLSGEAREAVLDLLDIAQDRQATRTRGAQLIARLGLAGQNPATGRHFLTSAGAAYLQRVFAPAPQQPGADELATVAVSL